MHVSLKTKEFQTCRNDYSIGNIHVLSSDLLRSLSWVKNLHWYSIKKSTSLSRHKTLSLFDLEIRSATHMLSPHASECVALGVDFTDTRYRHHLCVFERKKSQHLRRRDTEFTIFMSCRAVLLSLSWLSNSQWNPFDTISAFGNTRHFLAFGIRHLISHGRALSSGLFRA